MNGALGDGRSREVAWRKAQQIITQSKDKLGGMGMGVRINHNHTTLPFSFIHTHTHTLFLSFISPTNRHAFFLSRSSTPPFISHSSSPADSIFSGQHLRVSAASPPPIFPAALLVTPPNNFGLFSSSFIFFNRSVKIDASFRLLFTNVPLI